MMMMQRTDAQITDVFKEPRLEPPQGTLIFMLSI